MDWKNGQDFLGFRFPIAHRNSMALKKTVLCQNGPEVHTLADQNLTNNQYGEFKCAPRKLLTAINVNATRWMT